MQLLPFEAVCAISGQWKYAQGLRRHENRHLRSEDDVIVARQGEERKRLLPNHVRDRS